MLSAAGALAAAGGLAPELAARGWSELRFDGKTPNSVQPFGESGLRLISDRSVSMVYRPLSVDLARTPLLRWRWRVLEAGPAADLATKGKDDRPAAIYVGFPYDPDHAGLWERMKRPLVELRQGADAPGKVLVYVWGGNRAAGARFDSPYMGDASANRIIRPGDAPTAVWFEETVDVAADFREAFGYTAPDPVQLALSADSDDTDSRSVAEVADLAFVAEP